MRAVKVCSDPTCPELQPCPDHSKIAWAGSGRRTRTVSGSRQAKRARFVLMRDEGVCHVCGLGGANEADHVIPLAEGGEDHVDNMAPIHAEPCHREKTQREAQRARA